jgi:hypothetical protein
LPETVNCVPLKKALMAMRLGSCFTFTETVEHADLGRHMKYIVMMITDIHILFFIILMPSF